MTMRTVFLPLSLLLASSLLAACGTGLPDAASSFSLAEMRQLYTNNDTSQSWPEDRFQMLGQPQGKPGFGHGGPMGGPGFAPEASAEQQAFLAALKTAFVSDSFETAALSALLPSPPERPAPDPEQLQAKAEALIARAQAGHLPATPPQPPVPTDGADPHLSRLQSALNLSESQISQLQALRPDQTGQAAAHAERHAALLAELSKDSPSVEALVALLQPPDDSARPSPLQALADLHSILSPEQRQLAVDQDLLPLRPPGHGMHGAPGAHGGHGGQMGPKGPRPGPGFGGFGQPGGYSGY